MLQQGMHCFISGRVQGVFFRANTQRKAKQLNITGWVRNLPDGRVEVMAYGTEHQLKDFQLWLQQGPPLAKVTNIETHAVVWQEHIYFETR